MRITVSSEDIAAAGPGIISNPIACALQRATGTKWRVWNGEVAYELLPPYRTVTLPLDVQQIWDECVDFRHMTPFSFDVDLDASMQIGLDREKLNSLDIAA
ncbi:MAG: hypothetical protein JWN98_22 [Abditibacteriota bacterium]|nr:hypothetical protein [Abditibacteriota bacterium]